MAEASEKQATGLLADRQKLLSELESAYKHIHSHPELSMQESRTADIAADHCRQSEQSRNFREAIDALQGPNNQPTA